MQIESFNFYRTPQIIFGSGTIDKLGDLAARYGKKALLVTGSKSITKSGYRERIQQIFKRADIEEVNFTVEHEADSEMVDEAVKNHKNSSIDLVVAVGGGSVIDAGKAISAMLPQDESVKCYLEGFGDRKHNGVKVPFIAIPTTSGTGSEASANAVLTIDDKKRSIRHPNLVPDIALIDPELTISCPPLVTASCGMDALTQLIESYVSTKSSPLTDHLIEGAVKGIANNLIKATENGDNSKHREKMAYASLISGITLANSGLGTVHGIAPIVGGRFPVAHGLICGLILAGVTEKTVKHLKQNAPDSIYVKKYARLSTLITESESAGLWEDCSRLVETLYNLKNKLKLPSLSTFKIDKEHLKEIALQSGNRNNPHPLSNSDIENILTRCL
ncbi:iron-containing alcohol dehydrogenase [Chitinispirillales bacterium ANBcel5]|uniref:iron-containing alcohol dehydrogenase n=1 Tax=Cellulosispirillum alkaliphilum TaxID=3039283 RepID=UPI002A56833D|nr:iron-containing alcohol dehydrogenase [Chitinispirillales bacterium ANBcel5]